MPHSHQNRVPLDRAIEQNRSERQNVRKWPAQESKSTRIRTQWQGVVDRLLHQHLISLNVASDASPSRWHHLLGWSSSHKWLYYHCYGGYISYKRETEREIERERYIYIYVKFSINPVVFVKGKLILGFCSPEAIWLKTQAAQDRTKASAR